jgi:nuclear pore complex protein Nup155
MKLFLDLFHLDLCLFYCGLLLDMLEGKLAVLRFQIKIKEELEHMASSSEVLHSTSNYVENGLVSDASPTVDANFANATREKAKELSSDLKSITQLHNEFFF